jgi:hypothetical protein
VEKGGDEWNKLREIVDELKCIEEPVVWDGYEVPWRRLPGLNWVSFASVNSTR